MTELWDLLFLPRKVLVQNYRIIKKYDELCVFTGYHKYWEERVRSQFPGQRKKQKEERKKRLQLLGKDNNFDASWELDPFISADTREKIENNIQMFRLNEVYQYHKEELRLVLKRRQMLSSRRYVEEVKKLVGEEDLDEILLGIPEKPENLGKRILAKAKHDVVKRN